MVHPSRFSVPLFADTANAIAHVVQAFHEQDASAQKPSILDMGAGKGHYVLFYRLHGLDSAGMEGVLNIDRLTNHLIKQQDLSEPFSAEACEAARADWVTCLEVAEHIHVWHAEALLHNINCSARRGVVISWAPPGQYGSGHVNLRSKSYVYSKFTSMGFAYDMNATRAVSRNSVASHYIAKNVMVFRRPHVLQPLPDAAPLLLLLPRESRHGTQPESVSLSAERAAESNATSRLSRSAISIVNGAYASI